MFFYSFLGNKSCISRSCSDLNEDTCLPIIQPSRNFSVFVQSRSATVHSDYIQVYIRDQCCLCPKMAVFGKINHFNKTSQYRPFRSLLSKLVLINESNHFRLLDYFKINSLSKLSIIPYVFVIWSFA